MIVVILAAGQGRRLLPLTHDLPKCLLPFAGRPLIAWQLDALALSGVVDEVVVVTGFAAAAVERTVKDLRPAGLAVSFVYNPFYTVTDNIVSCWIARDHFDGEIAILNGDVLFEPEIPRRLRAAAERPLTVAIDRKPAYDADDMKVQTDASGTLALRIGKTLPPPACDAESIGLVLLRGLGGPLFATALEMVMRQPGGVGRWFLSAVDELAGKGMVGCFPVDGLGWTEVDYPADLARAEAVARGLSQAFFHDADSQPSSFANRRQVL